MHRFWGDRLLDRVEPLKTATSAGIDKKLAGAWKLAEAGQTEAARSIYKKITEEHPDLLAGWLNLGAIEDEISRQGDGLFGGKDAFAKAMQIRIVPSIVNDLGNILLRNEHRWQEAEQFYKEAVIRHGFQEAAENLAVCLLSTAPIKGTPEGWKEAWQWYEWRKLHKFRNHELVWRGEPLAGKRIIIKFEQGFGDHIFGLRFVKQAKEEGATTICLCPPNTIRLAIAQPYVDEVYDDRDDHQIEADYITMLMSMPGYMLPDGMPRSIGKYIETASSPVRSEKPRVGLAWAGSTDIGYQAWRNIKLADMAHWLDLRPDIEFVSLQRGCHEADEPGIHLDRNSILECRDLWDTARLVETLDLVISSDTMIPHLSASLGVETVLMENWGGCWFWGIDGHNPGWYDHVEIHREPSFKNWSPVIAEITEKLMTWKPRERS